tara:strand:+ start:2212 stop:3042 length:831 start_codon:yes stop_codon:yes gene_type:complete
MILLTGATGFVGEQVLKELLDRSLECTIVCRNSDKIKSIHKKRIKNIIISKNIFTESKEWWLDNLKDIDIVIHIAWFVEPGEYLESEKNLECLIGSLNLAQAAKERKVLKFVGIGTCFEYDFNESKIDINRKLNPQNLYAACKVALFNILSETFKNKLDFLWCRLFYLYGDGENKKRFYPYLKDKMINSEIADLSDGSQIRDFLDVKAAAKIIVNAVLGNNLGPFNVCSGKEISLKDFAYLVADKHGSRELLNFGARPNNALDPAYVVGISTDIIN